jgi:hypothetical protein
MEGIRSLRRLCMAMIAVGAAIQAAPSMAAVPAPVVPATSTGNYTVSYTHCSGCLADWLEERTDGGAWKVIGYGAVSFTGKAAGTYYYRVGYFWWVNDPYFSYEWSEYGAEARVIVGADIPPIDSLETQLEYRYETRVGDINGDGRTDLFVNRTVGGHAGNGALDKVLLLQDAAARFSARAPSATQVAAAQAWPRAAIDVTVRDFNVDGFADLLLKRVGAAVGVSSAANQIVFAPGRPLSSEPLGLRAVDADLKRFATDSREYFADSRYFSANAPLESVPYVVIWFSCDPLAQVWDIYSLTCDAYVYSTVIVVADYSVFDDAALSAWSHEASIEAGKESIDDGQRAIKNAYEGVLGVPIGGRDLSAILGERGSIDEPRYQRGLELFLAVFGIFDADADELDPKRESRKPDTVYVTGRKILGFLPRHTALEYAGSTLSAHDSDDSWLGDGRLVSQLNWPSDNPALMMTLGTVSSSLGAALYWGRLVAADAAYGDDLPYDALPSVGYGGYNSNGYTRGLVLATAGTPSIDMSRFVGGERPVPASEFR